MSKTGKGLSGSNLFSQLKENPGFQTADGSREEEKSAAGQAGVKTSAGAAKPEKKEPQRKKQASAKTEAPAASARMHEEKVAQGSRKTGRKAERKLPVISFRINGHEPVPVAYDDPDIPKKSIITIYTDHNMKTRFRDACWQNRLTMSEAVCFLMEQFIRETELQNEKK